MVSVCLTSIQHPVHTHLGTWIPPPDKLGMGVILMFGTTQRWSPGLQRDGEDFLVKLQGVTYPETQLFSLIKKRCQRAVHTCSTMPSCDLQVNSADINVAPVQSSTRWRPGWVFTAMERSNQTPPPGLVHITTRCRPRSLVQTTRVNHNQVFQRDAQAYLHPWVAMLCTPGFFTSFAFSFEVCRAEILGCALFWMKVRAPHCLSAFKYLG